MNAFYEHHKDSIRFGYRCFDRVLRPPSATPPALPICTSGTSTPCRRTSPGALATAARPRI
jgi:hypothetical protein